MNVIRAWHTKQSYIPVRHKVPLSAQKICPFGFICMEYDSVSLQRAVRLTDTFGLTPLM